MIGFLLRRFRWLAFGAGVKYVARTGVGRSVDEEAAKIEDRLPAPVVKAANILPGDIVKAGGAAVVSAKAARQSARVAKSGGLLAAKVTKAGVQMGSSASSLRPRAAVSGRIREARLSVANQAEADERELRADFLRYTGDEEGATNAQLDLRDERSDGPLPEVPEAIATGRRRFTAPRRNAEVGRVQRSYRRPAKPWDRPLRSNRESNALTEESGQAETNDGERGTHDR